LSSDGLQNGGGIHTRILNQKKEQRIAIGPTV